MVALLACLWPSLTATTAGQLSRLIGALLAMTGRVTRLGIARWADQGGSYRTVQRCFDTVISWPVLFWVWCRRHGLAPTDTDIFAGEECVVPKAGKKTSGVDRVFSSLYGTPVPGLSFLAWSWRRRHVRRSSPRRVAPMFRTAAVNATATTTARKNTAQHPNPKHAHSRKPGRPQGSKNREQTQGVLSPERPRLQMMMQKQLEQRNRAMPLSPIVVDGKFGHHPALHMGRGGDWHVMSKWRHDAARSGPSDGP